MKKLIALVGVLGVLTLGFMLYAQVTIPQAINFAILYPPPSSPLIVLDSTQTVKWKSDAGKTLISYLQADTTAMKAAYGSYQRAWTNIIMDTLTVNANQGQVTFRRIGWRGGGYKDTTVVMWKNSVTEIPNFLPYVTVVFSPFDSCTVGDQLTVAYITTRFF